MQFRSLLASILAVLGLTLSFYIEAKALTPTKEHKRATLEILHTLQVRHFSALEVNDELSERFLNGYFDRLDPAKTFFLATDIEEFASKKHQLDDELKAGNNNSGFVIYERYRLRLTERLKGLIEQLETEYTSPPDFSANETIPASSDKATWARNKEEADEIWRKRIKSYFLNQKLTGEEFSESHEKLVKRYKGQLDRISKNTAEDIYENYINSFTELYDPHTNYFSPRASESFSIRMSLSLEGIGAVLQSEDGYTKVVRIISAGPADKQGELKASDRISAVAQGKDGELVNVIGWRLDEVVDLIRGPKGSIVRLEIISGSAGAETSRLIEITRDKVKLEDQAAQKAVINLSNDDKKPFNIGVINIPTFYLDFEAYSKRDPNYRSTSKDVKRLLSELQEENVEGIIIDLRNNGGGSLYEASAVTDLFIDQGPVVQRGRDGGRKISDFSQEQAFYRGPLIVLINRLSASASEIFAGAIQDYNRGIIAGSASFGKGTVQTLLPLKSHGELKITESKFYRVSGDSTQHRGIIPDVLMPELIDINEVGESSYDTALAWSKTSPVRHGVYNSLDQLFPVLISIHDQRIKNDPGFIYLNERKVMLREIAEKTLISLNEKERLEEKEKLEDRILKIENKLRKAKNKAPFKSFTEYDEDNEKKNEERAARSGTTTIDLEDDAILKESAYILQDYITILEKINKQLAKAKPKK